MFQILLVIIYLAFISLGLPDSVLGAAWPTMYEGFGVPVSYAGVISMIIAAGTIVSSLQSDRLTRRFGAGPVTAVSVAMTAAALFGFSLCHSFPALCLWAVPYGLGAGSVDAALNNYVALHYASRHMSWLHCMWGVGTVIGPSIMGYALADGAGWNMGYRYISVLQILLAVVLVISLPLWKKRAAQTAQEAGQSKEAGAAQMAQDAEQSKEAGAELPAQQAAQAKVSPGGKTSQELSSPDKILTLGEILRIKGAKEIMVAFFCYCALEATAILWGSSYLVLHGGVAAETAASLAVLFTVGITVGRGINGFLTMKLSDTALIRLGQSIIGLGILAVLLPLGNIVTFAGLILIGLGCAPVYPCIIHSTPTHFGADKSQAVIGVQMASAYVGSCLMPPLFGLIANHISVRLFPVYLLVLLVLMVAVHERLIRKTGD